MKNGKGCEVEMADREKVIQGLNAHKNGDCTENCPYYSDDEDGCLRNLIDDALELLKEQAEIVRCKDCKYYRYYGPDSYILSECTLELTDQPIPTFFCECAERRGEAEDS